MMDATHVCLFRTILSIGYFALSLNTSNLAGSSYLNCFLSAAIEVPAYTMAWLMFRCCPRRLCLFSTLFLGGVVLLCINLIPPSKTQTKIEVFIKAFCYHITLNNREK